MARTPKNSFEMSSSIGEGNSIIDNIPAAGSEELTPDSAQDIDAIMAEVFRILAARGRAIREAHAESNPESTQGVTKKRAIPEKSCKSHGRKSPHIKK